MIVCIDSSTISVEEVERIDMKDNEYFYLTTQSVNVNNPLIRVSKIKGSETVDIFFTVARVISKQSSRIVLISKNKLARSLADATFPFSLKTTVDDFVEEEDIMSIMSSLGVEVSSSKSISKRTTNHTSNAFDFVKDKQKQMIDEEPDLEYDEEPDLEYDEEPSMDYKENSTEELFTRATKELGDDIIENMGKADIADLMAEDIKEKESPKWFGSITGLKGFEFKDEDVDFSDDEDLNNTKAMKMLNREDL